MTTRTSLCGGAALGALLALTLAPASHAATTTTHHRHRAPHHRVVRQDPMKAQVQELQAEIQQLKAQQDQQAATQAQTQAQVQQLNGQLQAANARADQAQAQLQEQIQTIPGQVNQQVAQQVAKHAPRKDVIQYKGLTIQLGGFSAAESVYRTKNNIADIGSNYSKIPYYNNPLAHTDEFRQTARQSRISFLVQGNVSPSIVASYYGEFDFLGAAQTANSNESNSYNLRIRHIYGALDFNDTGWHLLAGQNWSLVTMNTKGITPRNEDIPLTIDAQYVVGFVWARQPQIRVTKDFDDKQWWVAVSAENPQTTFAGSATGTGTTFGGVTVNDMAPGIGLYNSVNNYSFNHMPDVVGKVAYEPIIGGSQPLHVEVFGLLRNFYDQSIIAAGSQATLAGYGSGKYTNNTWGGGVGGGIVWTAVPKLLDLQGNVLTGRGIGRYGSGQLPDVVVGPTGNLEPIDETLWMAGGVLHATKKLDIYVNGGQETEGSKTLNTTVGATAVHLGYGNSFAALGNCFVEMATCSPDTRQITQVTVGLWDKLYDGSFGSFRVGLQYSHTTLDAFSGLAGANTAGFAPGSTVRPSTSDDMVFTSIRYYPF